jgi:hypothetical protein
MRSGQDRREIRRYFRSMATTLIALVAIILGMWVISADARAQSRSALFVGENASGLFDRIRGQTADLDWSLTIDRTAETLDLQEALAIGEKQNVTVVIWFDVSSKNRVTINAAEVATKKLFQRRVELNSDNAELSASTIAEAVALVVRSVLSALDEEKASEPSSQPKSDTAPAVVKTTSPTKSPGSTEPNAASSRPESHSNSQPSANATTALEPRDAGDMTTTTEWQLAVGWRVSVDGLSPIGQEGPFLRVGFNIDRLQLALSGYVAIPAALESHELTIDLFWFGALPSIGYEFVSGPDIRLSTNVAAGVAFFDRSTKIHVGTLSPTSDALKARVILQWEVRLQWFPSWLDRTLGFEFAPGLAILPTAPVFGVQEGNRVVDKKTLWTVQPAFYIALVLRTD